MSDNATTPMSGKTVLITGGSGALAQALVRHLVATHGVRHALLVSRRGEQADGFAQLRQELHDQGARVSARRARTTGRRPSTRTPG